MDWSKTMTQPTEQDRPMSAIEETAVLVGERFCTFGVGCEETGVCYAEAYGDPSRCGQPQSAPRPEAGQQPVRVYLVAEDCVRDGRQMYSRHDERVPMADNEVLYTSQQPAPQQAAEPVAILCREIGETTWFDHTPIRPGTTTHMVRNSSPEWDTCEVYAGHPPAQPDHMAQSEQMENAAYALGVIEMGLAVKQLCSDFSDRVNRPYMKDVTDAIAALAGQVANEGREAHSDDLAVDFFAHAMKQKLAQKRDEGRGGWEQCDPGLLSEMLIDHIGKGDPVDVANFCMMLHQTGRGIVQPEQSAPIQTGDFERGALTVIALIIRCHDAESLAFDILNEMGLNGADCSELDECDKEDLSQLIGYRGAKLRGLTRPAAPDSGDVP
jgi:hypothetical protein